MGHEKDKYQACRFPGQKAGETIRLIIRKHWIIDVKIGLSLFLVGILPILIGIAAGIFSWNGTFSDLFLMVFMGFTVYFLIILLITYIKWLNEELDIIIATDERLVSHEQINLFHRQVSEAHIEQIQDVTGTENGFLQNIFHYGTLEIQTSSSDIFFLIRHVIRPYENARALLDLRDNYLKSSIKKAQV